jgi:hypothetical protein
VVAVRATLSVVESPPKLDPLPEGGFEQMSDERFEAELRAAGLLVTGSGGTGHGDPGDSGGGGGGGEGWDGEENWGPRHYSSAVRVVALVAASFLMLGTAGAWISVAIGSAQQTFPSQVAVQSVSQGHTPRTAASRSDGAVAASANHSVAATNPSRGTPTRWHVALWVTNRSGQRSPAVCEVVVDAGNQGGWVLVPITSMHRDATLHRMVTVTAEAPPPGAPSGTAHEPIAMAACGPR